MTQESISKIKFRQKQFIKFPMSILLRIQRNYYIEQCLEENMKNVNVAAYG